MPVTILKTPVTKHTYISASKIVVEKPNNRNIIDKKHIEFRYNSKLNVSEIRFDSAGRWYMEKDTPEQTVKEINKFIANGYVVKLHMPVKKWYEV